MRNPWKAFQPYDEGSAANFKGREENVKELLSIILQDQTSVCYADSGIGKSSLINAGLKPALRQKNLFPVDILFTEEKLNVSNFDFDKFIINRLHESITEQNELKTEITFGLQLNKEFESEKLKIIDDELSRTSLWWILHTRSISFQAYGVKALDFSPIFIFDQFEEIFSNTVNERFIIDFFDWFLKVSASCMPTEIEEKLKEAQIGEVSELQDSHKCKFLFSIRQDAMGTLDYWISQRLSVPALRKNHYCLRALTREQARRVIVDQGVDTLDLVANLIIDEVIEKNSDAVPAILLSVFCSRLYDKAVTQKDGTKKQVKKEDVSANRKTLIRDFYEYLLNKTGIKEKHIRIIEDCLVSKSTGKRKRTECEHHALENIRFNQQYKEKLLDCYLISHTIIEGTEYIEISHDKVAEAISSRQKERILKRNLNSWRLILFLLPVFLIVASYAYLVTPKEGDISHARFLMMQEGNNSRYYKRINLQGISKTVNIRKAISQNYNGKVEIELLEKVIVEESHNNSTLNLQFSNCPNLSEVWMSDNIEFIPKGAFKNCKNLKIYIHPYVRTIHHMAFDGSNLTFDIDTLNSRFIWKDGVLWDLSETDHPILYIKEDILQHSQSVPFIVEYKDSGSISYRGQTIYNYKSEDLRIITDEDKIIPSFAYRFAEVIDLSAFDNIRYISAKSFKECKRLKEIILPPNLEYIEEQAFAECHDLKSIRFPSTLKTIGKYAFANCINLNNISFDGDRINLISSFAFANCRSLETLHFPNYVQDLESCAVIDCSGLKSVSLPNRIGRSISNFAFHRCSSLNDFIIRTNKSVFEYKDGYVLHDNNLLYADADIRINYSKNNYFSSDGIAFEKNNKLTRIVCTNSNSESFPNGGIFNLTDKKDSVLHLNLRLDTELLFVKTPEYLKRIHIPFTSPDRFHKKATYYFRISDLPGSIKRNITLVVPKGCYNNYADHPAFQGYKDIIEDSLAARIGDITELITDIIKYNFEKQPSLLIAIIFALLIVCIIFYRASYLAIKNSTNRSKLYSVLNSLMNIMIILLTFIGFYWSADILLNASSIFCACWAIFACLVVIFILYTMGHMTFRGLLKNRKQLFSENKILITSILKAVFIVSVTTVSYLMFINFKEKRDDYVEKVMQLCEKVIEKEGSCYGIMKECLSQNTIRRKDSKKFVPIAQLKTKSDLLEITDDGNKMFLVNKNIITMWNMKTLQPLNTLSGHIEDINDIYINGKFLISCSYDKVVIWDTDCGKIIKQLEDYKGGNTVAISSDGKIAVIGSGSSCNIIDVENEDTIHRLPGTHNLSIAFNDDDTSIAIGYLDGMAIVWDAETGEKKASLIGHSDRINSVNFSPDGKWIITGSSDDTAMIWDAETGAIKDTLSGMSSGVRTACFSGDGKNIITGSLDRFVRIWDAETKDKTDEIEKNSSIMDLAVSDDGRYIIFQPYNGYLNIWGTLRNTVVPELTINELMDIYHIGFKYDKWYNWIIITYIMTLILIFSYLLVPASERQKYIHFYKFIIYVIAGLVLFISAQQIITVQKNKPVKLQVMIQDAFTRRDYDECLDIIYRKVPQKDLYSQRHYMKAISSTEILYKGEKGENITYSRNGETIATYDNQSNTIKIIEVSTGKIIKGILTDDIIFEVALSGSGKLLAEVSESQTTIRETLTGRIINKLNIAPESIIFSPDERFIMTEKNSEAVIWDIYTGKLLNRCRINNGFELINLAFYGDGNSTNVSTIKVSSSPDGKRHITADNNSVSVWNENQDFMYKTSEGHDEKICALAISPDGRVFASSSYDNTVVVWDLETGIIINTFKTPGRVSKMNFYDNDKMILRIGMDVLRWDIEKHSSIKYEECLRHTRELYRISKTE